MIETIKNAKMEEMDGVLQAVRSRYRELFPQWDLIMVSIEKNGNRNEQLEKTIRMLENLKD